MLRAALLVVFAGFAGLTMSARLWTAGVGPILARAGPAAADFLRAGPRHEYTQVHMGMPVRLVVHAATEAEARAAATAAFARIAALDRMMSDYRDDSELRALERAAEPWVAVSPELGEILARAVEIAEATGGAFDPTVGPVVALWREARRSGRAPDPHALERARGLVGWTLLEVDRGRRVRLARRGMRLDLGGIAKGYILHEALRTLAANGVPRALVEAGGDIVVGDAPPGRDGWRIDVPGAGDAFASRARRLTHGALATSGPAAQHIEIDGVRYSHTIDPRTGSALTSSYTAHVIAADAATADALATALTVLGPDGIHDIVARFPGAAAIVIGQDSAGRP